jgi:sensor histidine kinase YesM
MKWYDLVFSDEQIWRYRRHSLFWLIWWIYFTSTFFYSQQGFAEAGTIKWILVVLIKSLLIMLCHAFIVYTAIYFLLPLYFLKAKYFSFGIGLLIAASITIAWGYFCYILLFRLIDELFHLPSALADDVLFWNSLTAGLLSALKIVMAATAVKLLKNWMLKQKEKEKLENEKIDVDLQLLKAQIHPDFLFSSLSNIRLFAQHDPAKASELLLKLSDLLSYMLYECDQPKVLLEKEIRMIRDYMALEKKRFGDRLEMDIHVQGDLSGKMIAPLLLLPFIENSFSYCFNEKLEKGWINVDLRVEVGELILKIVNGKADNKVMAASPLENGLANVHKRLDILYDGRTEIRMNTDPDMMITILKIKLEDAPVQDQLTEKEQITAHAQL